MDVIDYACAQGPDRAVEKYERGHDFVLLGAQSERLHLCYYICREDCRSMRLPSGETSLRTGCGRMSSQAHASGSHWVRDHPRPGVTDSLKR